MVSQDRRGRVSCVGVREKKKKKKKREREKKKKGKSRLKRSANSVFNPRSKNKPKKS